MKRIIPFLILAAALLAVPAISQGNGEGLAQEVESLQEHVDALTAQCVEQGKQIEALQKRLDSQQAEAKHLLQSLKQAETGGFTMAAPNLGAREALLKGLIGFANVAAGNDRDAPVKTADEEEE